MRASNHSLHHRSIVRRPAFDATLDYLTVTLPRLVLQISLVVAVMCITIGLFTLKKRAPIIHASFEILFGIALSVIAANVLVSGVLYDGFVAFKCIARANFSAVCKVSYVPENLSMFLAITSRE